MSYFDLHAIPSELTVQITRKLSVCDFLKFQSLTKDVHSLCAKRQCLVTLQVPYIQCGPDNMIKIKSKSRVKLNENRHLLRMFSFRCRIFDIFAPLDNDSMRNLLESVKSLRATCTDLRIYGSINCEQKLFCQLIELVGPIHQLFIEDFVPRAVLPAKSVQNVEWIDFERSDYENEDLMSLFSTTLSITSDSITSFGINQILKQWLREERRIAQYTFNLSRLSADTLFEDLQANLMYSSSIHEQSILSQLDPRLLNNKIRDWSFYVLIRPTNLEQMCVVKVHENSVFISIWSDPVRAITYFLLPEDFEVVTGRCCHCEYPVERCLCTEEIFNKD